MEIIFKKLTEVTITNGKILNKQYDYEKKKHYLMCKKDFLQFRGVVKYLSHKHYQNYQTKLWFWYFLKSFKVRKELSWRPQL